MSKLLLRVVIDTSTLLRGVLSETSAAAKLRRAAENRSVIPLLSKPVIDEYRRVLSHPSLLERFPAISVFVLNAIYIFRTCCPCLLLPESLVS